MQYRKLGLTGLEVSEIGMGCEGFISKTNEEVKAMVNVMEDNGINIIDLYSPNPQLRQSLSLAYKGKREKFILQSHLSSIWENGQYLRTRDIKKVKVGFECMLKELNTDYIDIGMIHYIDAMKDLDEVLNGEIYEYAKELKKSGKIKYIGMSSHNPEVALKAVNSKSIEVLMFSINPCYDLQPADEDVEQLWNPDKYSKNLVNMDPLRKELYEKCEANGIGITVMKAFGGGDLLNSQNSPAKASMSVIQCIHYALTRPAVSSVMVGARSVDEIKQSLKYETATEDEKDYATTLKN
ncbi:aldo/keto reductase, partial [bacterium]|nr:aldo/keto reductase [bacterium]